MKLQFVCYDNIDVIKSNLDSWVNKFSNHRLIGFQRS